MKRLPASMVSGAGGPVQRILFVKLESMAWVLRMG